MEACCVRHGVPLRAAALQFPLAHPALRSVVVGMRSAQEVVDNVEAMRLTVPAALWQELRAEGLIDPSAPVPGT